jgi:large subunit ribosomal protein L17
MVHKHGITKLTLSRPKGHRTSMIRGLASSLLEHEHVVTTTAKARAVTPYVERVITIAKKNDLSAKRRIAAMLSSEAARKKTVDELSKRYQDRRGGYVSRKKAGFRLGDNAELIRLELIKADKPATTTPTATAQKTNQVSSASITKTGQIAKKEATK